MCTIGGNSTIGDLYVSLALWLKPCDLELNNQKKTDGCLGLVIKNYFVVLSKRLRFGTKCTASCQSPRTLKKAMSCDWPSLAVWQRATADTMLPTVSEIHVWKPLSRFSAQTCWHVQAHNMSLILKNVWKRLCNDLPTSVILKPG